MNDDIPNGQLVVILILASVLIYFRDQFMPVMLWLAILSVPVSAIYHILRWYFDR